MNILDSFHCIDCDNDYEAIHDNKCKDPVPCDSCNSTNTKKTFTSVNLAQSDGNFHNKVPNGFRDVLNSIGDRAGRHNKNIDTNLGEV